MEIEIVRDYATNLLRSIPDPISFEIGPEIYIDVDKRGRTLNIEIIGAREKVGARNFNSVTIGNKNVALPAFA